jgi:cell division GTPase FtsZ
MLSPGPSSQGVRGTADDVVRGLVGELLGLFRSPPTTPVNTADARALLSTGGVALAYRGCGTREDIPEALLDHAVTHRLCDGDGARADGVLGLLRAGPTLELREYDALYEHVSAEVRPPYVGRERWVRACRTTSEFEDTCTLMLLLTGIDPESLPFLETERVS